MVETELEDIKVDKKIKLKELNDQRVSRSANAQQEVDDLEAENRSKDAELERLNKLLKERKDLLDRANAMQRSPPTNHVVSAAATLPPAAYAYNAAADLRYEQLSNEIKTIKVQLATMTEV